jgi:hypothetical protein
MGNYLVVRVPTIYAPWMVNQLQQSPYAQQVYVAPQGYYPVPVSEVPVNHQVPYYVPNVNQFQPAGIVNQLPHPGYPGTPRPQPVNVPLSAVYNPPKEVNNPVFKKAEPIKEEVIEKPSVPPAKTEKTIFDLIDDVDDDDSSYCFSDSEDSDSELEIDYTVPSVPANNVANFSPVPLESDDVAYAIQLDYIINESEPQSFYIPPPEKPKPKPQSNDVEGQELSMDEILHLYKSGEPVQDYVHFYIGLHPEQADQVQKVLESEIASESILSNVQLWKKECEKQAQPMIVSPEDFFSIDYNTPDDEDDMDYNYDYDYDD